MVLKCVLCVGTVILLVQVALAQEWSTIANPSPRSTANMVYDARNRRMVLFGGGSFNLRGDSYNDVWALDVTPGNEVWHPLFPAGTPPSPRFFSSAIYDSVGQRMIVFGGSKDWDEYFNDVWVLTLEPGSESWEEMQVSGTSPSPRCAASAIYDGDLQRMIIFAGVHSPQFFDDVWSLDLAGLVWQSFTPAGTPPAARHSHTAVYDPMESRMIVFGGHLPDRSANDVWTLDLTPGNEAWTQLSVSGESPQELSNHLAIYDKTSRRMYTFGGFYYPPFEYPEDLFYLDLSSLEWTRISLHPTPPGRRGLSGNFDYHNRRLIIFGGGRYYDYYFGDTYALTIPSVVVEDVGPISILSPPSGVFPDSTYSPSAMIRNFGPDWLGPIPVICTIDSWADTVEIVGIGGLASTVVDFDSWTVPQPGVYTVTVMTQHAGDTYPANDTFSIAVRGYVFGDAGPISITSPPDTIYLGSTYASSGTIQNFGTDSVGPILVICSIDSWTDTVEIPIISGADSTAVNFSNWTVVDTGVYSVTIFTLYPADTNSANDTLLKMVRAVVPVAVDEIFRERPLPSVNAVCQSYPNPTSSGMTISYQIAQTSPVSLKILDNAGRLIRVLVEAETEPGYYTVKWDGKDGFGQNLPNGAYFYTLKTETFASTKKTILLR